jgi:cytochrome c5
MSAGWVAVLGLLSGCSETLPPPAESTKPAVGVPPSPLAIGQRIYGEYCFSCHSSGLNGAPKLGDKEGWAPRIAKGEALLLQTTIEGIPPAMPPRGICMRCSDEELAHTIAFMIAHSR